MTRTRDKEKETVEFEIVPDAVDGWDVTKAGENQALSNHSSRRAAEAAARLRGREEQADEIKVSTKRDSVHEIDEESRGMRTTFLAIGGLLLLVAILIVVVSLLGSTTGFGS